MEQDITKLLEQLAVKLGTTVEFLWGILVKQQYIDSIVNFFIVIIFSIVSIICYKKLMPKILEFNCKKGMYDDVSKRTCWLIVYWAFQGILFIVILILLIVGIQLLLNPEYYALKEILQVIK